MNVGGTEGRKAMRNNRASSTDMGDSGNNHGQDGTGMRDETLTELVCV